MSSGSASHGFVKESPCVLYSLIFAALTTHEKLETYSCQQSCFLASPALKSVRLENSSTSPSALPGWSHVEVKAEGGEAHIPGGCFIRQAGVSTCSLEFSETPPKELRSLSLGACGTPNHALPVYLHATRILSLLKLRVQKIPMLFLSLSLI